MHLQRSRELPFPSTLELSSWRLVRIFLPSEVCQKCISASPENQLHSPFCPRPNIPPRRSSGAVRLALASLTHPTWSLTRAFNIAAQSWKASLPRGRTKVCPALSWSDRLATRTGGRSIFFLLLPLSPLRVTESWASFSEKMENFREGDVGKRDGSREKRSHRCLFAKKLVGKNLTCANCGRVLDRGQKRQIGLVGGI